MLDLVLLSVSLSADVVTLPVSPYPASLDCEIALVGESGLQEGRIVNYQTRHGQEAEIGTYDALWSMLVDVTPTEGMSGQFCSECISIVVAK